MTFWRTFHLLNIGVQFVGMSLFLWGWTLMHSPGWLWFAGWCALHGALSCGWLRASRNKAAQTAKGNGDGLG